MAKFPNPASWDSEGNLLVPRHGIRITMGLALLAAGVWFLLTFLTDAELRKVSPLEPRAFPESLWTMILWAALPLVPFSFLDGCSHVIVKKPLLPGRVLELGYFFARYYFRLLLLCRS